MIAYPAEGVAHRSGVWPVDTSIFLDFRLPNSATWFYFSLILSLAVFFQFARPFCVRNLDLLTLYLLAPGFLLLQEAHRRMAEGRAAGDADGTGLLGRGQQEALVAYGWLLIGSAYWFGRSLFDLALVRRPAYSPNLTTPGLACLGLALFVGLTSVAMRRTTDPADERPVGQRPMPIEKVRDQAAEALQKANAGWVSKDDLRFWVERGLAMACHAAVVVGLLMIGLRHFQDRAAGIAMGTLYLLVPYTAYHIGQIHHVWPTAFLLWAVFCYRRPVVAGWLLGLAAGSALFPALLFPLWCGFYARRGAGRFTLSFLSAAAVSLGVTALVVGWDGLATALHLSDWPPWQRTDIESVWRGARWAYRLPLFVLFVAFLVGVTVWPSPKNLSHLIALSAAVLLGVQFWYADRGGVYVLWYLPLLLLLVFRPNLSAAEPPGVEPGTGVVARIAGAAWRRVRPNPPPPKELAV